MKAKSKSKKMVLCKKIALVSVFITATCAFSVKTIAQNEITLPERADRSVTVSTQTDLFSDSTFTTRYKEYNQIIESYIVERGGRKTLNLSSISKGDLDRMKKIFLSMSPEQQAVLSYTFQRLGVPDKKIPTKEQLESWKVPTEYGIWLDGKRIENSELNRYQSSDFSHFFVSRLARNAKDYGKYVYHLELSTTTSYRELKAKLDADKTLYLTPNPSRIK